MAIVLDPKDKETKPERLLKHGLMFMLGVQVVIYVVALWALIRTVLWLTD